MASVVRTEELDGRTRFYLSDGKIVEAEYGYSTGSETGIHNRFDTRNLLSLYDSEDDIANGYPSDTAGFHCTGDDEDGDYDWGVWDIEVWERLEGLGWIDDDEGEE